MFFCQTQSLISLETKGKVFYAIQVRLAVQRRETKINIIYWNVGIDNELCIQHVQR
jgi:hypothetical protein